MPDDFIGEDNKAEMPAEHLPIPIASSVFNTTMTSSPHLFLTHLQTRHN